MNNKKAAGNNLARRLLKWLFCSIDKSHSDRIINAVILLKWSFCSIAKSNVCAAPKKIKVIQTMTLVFVFVLASNFNVR